MTRLSTTDRSILKKLIAGNVLTVDDARRLVQTLEKYRAKDPEHCITDVLVEEKLLAPSQMNALLSKVEQEEEALEAAAPPPHRQARTGPGPASARRFVARRRSSPMVPLFLCMLLLCFGGLAGFIVWQDRQSDVPSTTPEPETTTLEKAQLDRTPARPESSEDVEAMRARVQFLDPAAVRRRLDTIGGQESLKTRLTDLRELAGLTNDRSLANEIESAITVAQEAFDEEAQIEFEQREEEIFAAIDAGERRRAIEIYRELLDRFGTEALDGKIARAYEDARATAIEEVVQQLSAGKNAYWEKRYEDAERAFEVIVELGDPEQVTEAERWLAKIEKRGARDDSPVELGKPEPAVARSDTEEVDDSAAEDEDPEAAKVPAAPAGDLAKVRARLAELFAVPVELSADGILTVTYDFEKKNDEDARDWAPSLDGKTLTDSVRWTRYQEETVVDGATGVRISNDGAFRHKAKLMLPVQLEVKYHSQNQFWPKNVVAPCWVNDKGRGVGTNMGLQTAMVAKFQCHKMAPPRLPKVTGFASYNLKLELGEEEFHGMHRSQKTRSRKMPSKLESGYCGIVFANQIAGTIRSVKIRGKLDLDWALRELGEK